MKFRTRNLRLAGKEVLFCLLLSAANW